jgi:hypothetical protein
MPKQAVNRKYIIPAKQAVNKVTQLIIPAKQAVNKVTQIIIPADDGGAKQAVN